MAASPNVLGQSMDEQRLRELAAMALRPDTLARYGRAWAIFSLWCQAKGRVALPSTPDTVMDFLIDDDQHYVDSISRLRTFMAAVRLHHVEQGHATPGEDPGVRNLSRALARTLRRPSVDVPRDALRPDELRVVSRHLSDIAAASAPQRAGRLASGPAARAVRDKALLLLGTAAGLRCPELIELQWRDVTFLAAELELTVRYSKIDREGRGVTMRFREAVEEELCAVRALLAWRDVIFRELQGAPAGGNPLFCMVSPGGLISHRQLSPSNCSYVIVSRMAQAGVPGNWGGRSMRVGLVTTCLDQGMTSAETSLVSRHKSLDSMRRYIRNTDPFVKNAAAQVGC